ncbi:hypothetical protein [Symmachiella dynata]|uniref:hypothetical protein n=1 Tax=Symmachiella dynata TaxID=2527995 RepID=UPI0018D316A3|nr:hypothetical protein [Symmachiella dynata]
MRYLLLTMLLLCCPACTAARTKALLPDWKGTTANVVETRQVWHESTGHTLNAPTSTTY